MHIQFSTEGGFAAFPGLNRPVTIDTSALPAEEGAALERLIETTRFFDRPARASVAPKGAADYRQYTISVVDGERRHVVRLDEPINDAGLQMFVDQLQTAARHVGRGESSPS